MNGINYFPLDVHLEDNIHLIEAEFGLVGFGVIIKLYQRIYAQHGYYCEWNDEVSLLLSSKFNIKKEELENIVSKCIQRGIFSNELYTLYGILTSRGIQKRFLKITKRRKEISFNLNYSLLNKEEISELNLNFFSDNFNNADKTKENVCNIEENVDNFKQSKVKESKVKKSKVKESKEKESKEKGNTTNVTPSSLDIPYPKFNDPYTKAPYFQEKETNINLPLNDQTTTNQSTNQTNNTNQNTITNNTQSNNLYDNTTTDQSTGTTNQSTNQTTNQTTNHTKTNHTPQQNHQSKQPYGKYKNVLLTQNEFNELKRKYPDYDEKINDLDYYIGSTGKQYKSHYLTILSWIRRDQKKEALKDKPKTSKITLKADKDYADYNKDFLDEEKIAEIMMMD